MTRLRFLPTFATVALAAASSTAMWSPVPPADTLWKHVQGARVLVVRTGDARIDDGLEEGFRLSWPTSSWSWVPDSGISSVAKDSTVLVFRLAENWNPVRGSREEDCEKLSGPAKRACRADQAGAVFLLSIAGKTIGPRDGTWLLAEPSQIRLAPRGDAVAVDVVRDFALVLQTVRDSAYPVEGPLKGDNAWARESVVRTRRERVRPDTLWVPSAFLGKVTASEASEAFQGPVRFVGMDTLEAIMGTSRKGSYLEAGLHPAGSRQLRVRELASGDLLLIDDSKSLEGHEGELFPKDFERLRHRALGEEERLTWMASAGWEGSTTELMGYIFTLGYEFRREFWAVAGWTNQQLGPSDGGASQGFGLVGVRFTPALGWERKKLGPRVALGARWWQPLGDGSAAEDTRRLDPAPRMTFDLDLLAGNWFLGVSVEQWFGDNNWTRTSEYYDYNRGDVEYIEKGKLDAGGMSFRGGFHFGLPVWRPATPWRTAREKAQASSAR